MVKLLFCWCYFVDLPLLSELFYIASEVSNLWHDVHMIKIVSELRIKNTSESDPRSYEITVANKAQELLLKVLHNCEDLLYK